jgi:hypothetical protein
MCRLVVSSSSHSFSPGFPLFQAYISRLLMLLVFSLPLVGCGGHGSMVVTSDSWAVDTTNSVWTIAFGSGRSFPQYGALDTASGYLRLIPNAQSNWGTSVVIFPSFWSGGVYYQGTTIMASHSLSGNNLVIDFTGNLAGLSVEGRLTIFPPYQQINAQVDIISATGNMVLDNRPGEAFKLAMLSSMHISESQWDSQSALVGSQSYALPASGWIIAPPGSGAVFSLTGGTSSWKTNAPTMELAFPTNQTITGWVTSSSDPNDDNVGFWAAADSVISSYTYNITASP